MELVTIKSVFKGYQECRFDVGDVEDKEKFEVLRKIGEKGRAFRVVKERGQLGHIQRELVAVLWPLKGAITW